MTKAIGPHMDLLIVVKRKRQCRVGESKAGQRKDGHVISKH